MLDIKFIRENPNEVRKNLERRKDKQSIILLDTLLTNDREWKNLKGEVDRLNHERNSISEEINRLKKSNKDISKQLKQAKNLPLIIAEKEKRMGQLAQEIRTGLLRIPNLLHETVPFGKDPSENVEVRKWGVLRKFDFELKSHGELAESLGVADFKRAAKIAGTGFVYVKGALALMDLALMRFAIDFLISRGFVFVEPPLMMNRQAYEGVTDLADFEKVMYKIENEDLYMIATSEHPMVSMYMNEVLDENELPVKLVGVSPCFRKEIGSHGVDSRGFFRMHQFNKVEQVVLCKPEESWKLHEEIQKNSEDMLQALGIPYRVVNICTGDIGIVAAKKYDIEAWFPREKEYKEVTSASNCTSYQAARLNIKYRKREERPYVHTLNNTGIATSRIIRAILENYQQKDGTVEIPKALWTYTNKIKKITPF